LGLGSSSKPEEERGRALRSCSPSHTYKSSRHVISVSAYLPKMQRFFIKHVKKAQWDGQVACTAIVTTDLL